MRVAVVSNKNIPGFLDRNLEDHLAWVKKAAKKVKPKQAKAKLKRTVEARSPAQDRLDMITENNNQLYRDGIINRVQAKAAGVDVDAIDGTNPGETSGGVKLTAEELAALQTSA